MKHWTRELLTDRENSPDTGRVAVAIAVVAMLGLSAYDVVVHGARFDAQSLGIGIGAVVAGLGGYLVGDARRPPQPPGAGGTTTNL